MSWPTQHKVKWLTVSFSFLVLLNLFIYFWFLEAEKCMPFFFFFFYFFAFLSLNASSPYPSCSEPNVLDDSQGLAAEGSLSRYSVNATYVLVSVLGNKLFPVSSVSLSLCLLPPRLDIDFHSLPFVAHKHTSLEVKGVASFIFQLQSSITNGLKSLLKKKKNPWSSSRGLSHGPSQEFDIQNVKFIPAKHSLPCW